MQPTQKGQFMLNPPKDKGAALHEKNLNLYLYTLKIKLILPYYLAGK